MGTRRAFLRNICVAAAAGATVVRDVKALASEPSSTEQPSRGVSSLRFDSSVPVIQTSSGRVRGYIRNNIHTFKGIPYGAPTSGKGRFLPPRKPEPWTDVFNAVAYGYASLQRHGDDWRHPVQHFVLDFENGMMSEDCLNLNVWTQSLDNVKRPVLVWIHGGGFQNGSSFEMRPYDGENLTRRGDIVFVSVNHRLNALGFLDLSAVGGDEFKTSANVGMLDLVAALEWVRDNIAHFGGDPNNVTICGQSGGGGKVNALMRMPSAKGLFHKAIIQSGSFKMYRETKDSSRVGEELVKKLGLPAHDLSGLQNLPYDRLIDAASQVTEELRKQAGEPGPIMGRFGWSPTADGMTISGNGAPDISADIPLLVGYTRNEMATSAFDPQYDGLSLDQAIARIKAVYPGTRGTALISEYQKQYPNCTPAFLFSVVSSMMFSVGSISQVEERTRQRGSAPAYFYRFDWCPDIFDGGLGAFHTLDIAFAFDNTQRWDTATGGEERAQKLASLMSEAWVNFVRSGDPNHRQLPKWPTYNVSAKPTMIFDDVCRVLNGPDDDAYRIMDQKLS